MNAIRQAFHRAIKVPALIAAYGGKPPTGLELDIYKVLNRAPRLSRDEQRGWSTKVSFRTYHALQRQGILD